MALGTACGQTTSSGTGPVAQIPGGSWLKIHTPTKEELLDVWEDGHGIVWAVGRFGTVLRWDGARVEWVDLGHHGVDFQAIHGSSPEDIWIVGDEGVVLHFNGADWVERPITSHVRWLMDVWVWHGSGKLDTLVMLPPQRSERNPIFQMPVD
ncbi:hypothetical protein KJ975_13855 [Myxococcota bacterium]|nr:hypothetical protein [Myxococcota bacterium]